MKIKISDEKKISEIQKDFSDLFPFLKIVFYSKPFEKGKRAEKKFLISGTKAIGTFRTVQKAKQTVISPEKTVAEIEKNFSENYGLFIQILRQCGKMWIQTSFTDDWTIQEQNEHGSVLSTFK